MNRVWPCYCSERCRLFSCIAALFHQFRPCIPPPNTPARRLRRCHGITRLTQRTASTAVKPRKWRNTPSHRRHEVRPAVARHSGKIGRQPRPTVRPASIAGLSALETEVGGRRVQEERVVRDIVRRRDRHEEPGVFLGVQTKNVVDDDMPGASLHLDARSRDSGRSCCSGSAAPWRRSTARCHPGSRRSDCCRRTSTRRSWPRLPPPLSPVIPLL